MFIKKDLLQKIEQYRAEFVAMSSEVTDYSAEEIFDTYFYEESDELPTVGFNPQSGEHLRVGEKIYYHPDKSHLVPENLRQELREAKLDD
ncbi:hypothetical protein M8998_05985 [Sphingobacterium sp. lm-10]|uniref:hypothetical protein n=1 Tax=Sphingobacterium sp. lm-10 TaxID=2944904 RepID=UPI002020E5B3|nr:hypothetical protein [Sphingobacterium sp. lm-10]MCL7987485.1 hypothetical protein [Sphingobacterium sp. lm-10]